jgi:hypothetical protein
MIQKNVLKLRQIQQLLNHFFVELRGFCYI